MDKFVKKENPFAEGITNVIQTIPRTFTPQYENINKTEWKPSNCEPKSSKHALRTCTNGTPPREPKLAKPQSNSDTMCTLPETCQFEITLPVNW